MKNIVGVFRTRTDARCAIEKLQSSGIPADRISAATPGETEADLEANVDKADTEQPGMGGAIGGTIGGAIGAATGLELGIALSAVFLPAVGPVLAVGILGAALVGAGGAAVGAIAGNKLEENVDGIPHDELFVYEDALKRGHSVVFAELANDAEEDLARSAFSSCNSESIDQAREDWWVGLRDDEKLAYEEQGGSFGHDEVNYRRGFEAAHDTHARGKEYQSDLPRLESCFGPDCRQPAFTAGYDRGQKRVSAK